MNVWTCFSPNVGPFHVYPEKPGLIACDPAYFAHQKCGSMRLIPDNALVIERNDLGLWPKWAKTVIHNWFVGEKGEHPATDLLIALSVWQVK